jgi:hypothetical protein
MLAQAIMDEAEYANMLGDIRALFLVAFVLWFLMLESDHAMPSSG